MVFHVPFMKSLSFLGYEAQPGEDLENMDINEIRGKLRFLK